MFLLYWRGFRSVKMNTIVIAVVGRTSLVLFWVEMISARRNSRQCNNYSSCSLMLQSVRPAFRLSLNSSWPTPHRDAPIPTSTMMMATKLTTSHSLLNDQTYFFLKIKKCKYKAIRINLFCFDYR